MSRKVYVTVDLKYDTTGIITPLKIIWKSGKEYIIERVIHVCQIGPEVIKYVVLIGGLQKNLFNENKRWYVEAIDKD